jgi:hypothetical protein
MNELELPTANFERLALGYLIRGGDRTVQRVLDLPWGQELHDVTVRDPKFADLVALVGKACETCDGTGLSCSRCRRQPFPPNPMSMDRKARCPDCLGSGSALLTVTTGDHVRPPTLALELAGESECDRCMRSARVRLTGQPLQVLTIGDEPPESGPYIRVYPGDVVACSLGVGLPKTIDLGPDAATLVGRWAFPVEVVDV